MWFDLGDESGLPDFLACQDAFLEAVLSLASGAKADFSRRRCFIEDNHLGSPASDCEAELSFSRLQKARIVETKGSEPKQKAAELVGSSAGWFETMRVGFVPAFLESDSTK